MQTQLNFVMGRRLWLNRPVKQIVKEYWARASMGFDISHEAFADLFCNKTTIGNMKLLDRVIEPDDYDFYAKSILSFSPKPAVRLWRKRHWLKLFSVNGGRGDPIKFNVPSIISLFCPLGKPGNPTIKEAPREFIRGLYATE